MRCTCCIVLFFTLQGCGLRSQQLVDASATPETKALYQNLKEISSQGILYGHQETDAYGINWIAGDGSSDVKSVCSSYPAVHGWDVGKEGQERNLDGVLYADMKRWIIQTYERGGINTISWHMDNPYNDSSTWDKTPSVKFLLPGTSHHQKYVQKLDKVADFLLELKSGGVFIPIIFRPFHEHNGDWFWWGKGNCTEEEYIALWKFTIDYLKNKRGLHHVLYAFSPDRSRIDLNEGTASYLYGYPGDEYVDILGLDNYIDVGIKSNKKSKQEQRDDFAMGLQLVSTLAKQKNKIAALTETGLEGITNDKWHTEVILDPIKSTSDIQLAYVMAWRNANTKHHYAPYPGHPSATDFVTFYNDALTLFESDIQNVYTTGKPLVKK